MIRLPTRTTLTYPLFPYTTLFRSAASRPCLAGGLFAPQASHLRLPCNDSRDSKPSAKPATNQLRPVWQIPPPALRLPPGLMLGTQIGRAHVELQSLMRHSYAVFCLKKKNTNKLNNQTRDMTN